MIENQSTTVDKIVQIETKITNNQEKMEDIQENLNAQTAELIYNQTKIAHQIDQLELSLKQKSEMLDESNTELKEIFNGKPTPESKVNEKPESKAGKHPDKPCDTFILCDSIY